MKIKKNFIKVKKIKGIWWFIDPDGRKFISLGVNHIEPHLWLAPYNKKFTQKKYGKNIIDEKGKFDTKSNAAKKWIAQQISYCKELNFNTFGKHTHETINYKLYFEKIFYICTFETSPLSKWRFENGESPMPDVFSLEFKKHLENKIQNYCKLHKNNRNLLGYMYTDVPYWILEEKEQKNNKDNIMIYPWLNTILKLGAHNEGKKQWIKLLKKNHGSPDKVAGIWGLKKKSAYKVTWENLLRNHNWFNPKIKKKAKNDMVSFMKMIATKWYQLHYQIIKKYDQNHLILADKNMIDSYNSWLIDPLKNYVDVIVIQSYNLFSEDTKITDWIYKKTGKPIFNGDGSFAFVRKEQKKLKVKGWWTGSKNIKDVAFKYKLSLNNMMKKNYMIGWHHCGILEQWDTAERGDVSSNENGFMDPYENFHTDLTNVMKKVNSKAIELHKNSYKKK